MEKLTTSTEAPAGSSCWWFICDDGTCSEIDTRCPDGECNFGYKKCSETTLQCYSTFDECNGRNHCENGRDEAFCSTTTTLRWPSCWEKTCDSGYACYTYKENCDGIKHCSDGSDEWNCSDEGIGTSTTFSVLVPMVIVGIVVVAAIMLRCYRRKLIMNRYGNRGTPHTGVAVVGSMPPPPVPQAGVNPQQGYPGYPGPTMADAPPSYDQHTQYPPPQANQPPYPVQNTNKPYPVQKPLYAAAPNPNHPPPTGYVPPTGGAGSQATAPPFGASYAPPIGEGVGPGGDIVPPPSYEDAITVPAPTVPTNENTSNNPGTNTNL